MDKLEGRALLEALGETLEDKPARIHTPREERIIAGFEDIQKFVDLHRRAPAHGEGLDIFERLYAVRLERLRAQEDCCALLAELDYQGLLGAAYAASPKAPKLSGAALLAALDEEDDSDTGTIFSLKHVKPRAEIRAAEEIADRKACEDFATFKPLFDRVRNDLKMGARETRPFAKMAEIQQGEFFIVGGQMAYVAHVGKEFVSQYDRRDSRLRVIYDNGTESDVLLRSLQRALHRDEAGRRITNPSAGPLFGRDRENEDMESGMIYVLRSKSDHPLVAANREVLHKIGVTGGDVPRRVANAKVDPTYLMADVEIFATYELFNINRTKLENIIHRIFDPARLNIEIKDRFGTSVTPREWYLVPHFVIDEAVERIRDGSIGEYVYDPQGARLASRKNGSHI